MFEKLKRNGGKREERFAWELPDMGEKTPNRDPKGHWARVEAHLRSVNPSDRKGLRKARQMVARLAGKRRG